MSKILNLVWTNPSPLPTCGYNVLYRRTADPSYTTINTSGTTSGSSSLPILVSAPASYEGVIQSNCCSGNNSPGAPWGINAYNAIGVNVIVNIGPLQYEMIVTCVYGNPYNNSLSGSFSLNTTSGGTSGTTTITFSNAIFIAGSTNQTIILPGTPPTATTYSVSNINITSISPIFDYGGGLQRYDSLLSPPYFGLYYNTHVWNGSTLTHSSFLLNSFIVTQQDINNNALQGNLNISWIQGSAYMGGSGIYDTVTLTITDPGAVVVGNVTFSQTPLGLRNSTIVMNRTNPGYPLTGATLFTITATWADDSTISTTSFYLPPATV